MADIKNIEGMSLSQIEADIRNGGRFLIFPYVISILIMTFRPNSSITFVKSTESALKYKIGPVLGTLFLGWWGIPWGPIYSIGALYKNLTGGNDVTNEVLASLRSSSGQSSGGYNVPNQSSGGASNGGYNIPNQSSGSSSGGYNVPGNNSNSEGASNYNIR